MIEPGGAPVAPPWAHVTKARAALALLVLTLVCGLRYLAVATPLTEEEHFRLGEHLHATGVLSVNDAPSVLRPPGFPFFVAGVLHLRDALFPGLESKRAVALAHGCLLSLGALALFLHVARGHPIPIAFAAGVLYAFHPINLLFARVLSYYTLHIVCVTVSTFALSRALQGPRRRLAWTVAAGVLWGVSTLVRPVSLLLPPFVLLLARWQGGRGSWRYALRFTSLFTLGMALVIAPYTVRNYRLTHRLIAVNAQEGYALWGLSATKNPAGDFGEWLTLWKDQGMPIFRRVTGGSDYSIEALHAHDVALNDAFRAEAGRNIRRDPWRFAVNVAWSLYVFNLDSSYRWIERLEFVRDGGDWRPRVAIAKAVDMAMLLLGFAGLVRGLRAGDTDARVVAITYSMFCVAHCLALVLTRYTYVRLPLVLLALPLVLRGHGRNAGAALALLVLVATALAFELAIP